MEMMSEEMVCRKRRLSSFQIIILGFAGVILLGANNVVYPEKQMAKWAAIRYTSDHIFNYIEIDEQHAIFEVQVPRRGLVRALVS